MHFMLLCIRGEMKGKLWWSASVETVAAVCSYQCFFFCFTSPFFPFPFSFSLLIRRLSSDGIHQKKIIPASIERAVS